MSATRAVRRFGSNVVHAAVYGDDLQVEAKILGAECTIVDSPVATVCGAVLQGVVVEMRYWGKPNCCRRCRVEPSPRPKEPTS